VLLQEIEPRPYPIAIPTELPRIPKEAFLFIWFYSPIQALTASMKLSVLLQLLDLGQSARFLGWVISSSQDLHLYINTEKRTTQTLKYPCPEWHSNPRSRRSRERRHFRPPGHSDRQRRIRLLKI
jgi:hypothetical protein